MIEDKDVFAGHFLASDFPAQLVPPDTYVHDKGIATKISGYSVQILPASGSIHWVNVGRRFLMFPSIERP